MSKTADQTHDEERRSLERMKAGSLSLSTLGGKLTIGSGAMVSLLLGSSAIGSMVASQFKDATADAQRTSQMLRNHMQADMMHDALRGDAINAILAAEHQDRETQAEALKDVEEHAKEFQDAIATNDSLARTDAEKQLLTALRQPLSDYLEAASGIVKRAQTDAAGANAMMPAFREKFSALEKSMGEASDELSAQAEAAAQTGARQSETAQILMCRSWALASPPVLCSASLAAGRLSSL